MAEELDPQLQNDLNSLFAVRAVQKPKRKGFFPELNDEPESKRMTSLSSFFNQPSTSYSTKLFQGKGWMDTTQLMTDLSSFMMTYDISQSHIARRLQIKLIWISRMIDEPREWEKLPEMGKDYCRILRRWLNEPLQKRLNNIMEEIEFTQMELDSCEIDTKQMVMQIASEMETYRIPLSDFSKGSGVKYTWLYSFFKSPNIYDGFNTVGKHQARELHAYLKIPFHERMEYLTSIQANLQLDTVDIALRVNVILKSEVITLRDLCKELQIDNSRASVYLRRPVSWDKLNLSTRRMFIAFKNWLTNNVEEFPPEMEAEVQEKKKLFQDASEDGDSKQRVKKTGIFPEMNCLAIARTVKTFLRNFSIPMEKLSVQVGIPDLATILSRPGKWERLSPESQEHFRTLKRWLDTPIEQKWDNVDLEKAEEKEGS